MRKAAALLLACVLAAPAWGQTVTLPAKASIPVPGTPVVLTATADGANVVWLTPDPAITVIDGSALGGDSKRAMVFGSTPGTYRLWALTGKGDKLSPRAECLVTVGDPPPPVPPVPPGPNPPDPPAPPGDNPFPADGKARVLVVFDNAQTDLPAGLYNQIYGATFRDYLRSKTANEWRIWPKDTDASAPGLEVWGGALKKKFDSLPWIHLSNGKTGYSGPLPATRDETQKLMQKYGL